MCLRESMFYMFMYMCMCVSVFCVLTCLCTHAHVFVQHVNKVHGTVYTRDISVNSFPLKIFSWSRVYTFSNHADVWAVCAYFLAILILSIFLY